MYLSLFLIVSVNIGGYFICSLFIALLLLSIVQLTPVNIWVLNNIFAIFLNIAAASIGPILYFNRYNLIKKFFLKIPSLPNVRQMGFPKFDIETK